ncbi:MAG: hypothetical protein LUG21_05035 [Clostridiales bacterium]|nr:hypothetical protein [Clostridiales bacterium]
MKETISKLTKLRFEKQGLNFNNLIPSHFEYNEIIHLIDSFGDYDVEQIVVDSYDDENDTELCTWQACNYVGNWSSTQAELNENFIEDIKLINEASKRNDVNIDDYFYTYKDKYRLMLYFPLRLLKNKRFDDYLFLLTNKNRIVTSMHAQNNQFILYQMIEDSVKNKTGILFDNSVYMMLANGLIKSFGTMANYGVVFTIDNLFWTDNMHNICKPILAMNLVETKRAASVPYYNKCFMVVGSATPDGFSSGDASMFNSKSRYKSYV